MGATETPERLSVTVTEAAAMLGLSRSLAYRLIRKGAISSRRFDGRVVVPIADLRALVTGEQRDACS